MYKISELSEALARKAVLTAEMKKQAVSPGEWWAGLSPTLRSGLTGAAIGGGGAGLISALSGRRRGQFLKDLLLGGLVGGAGGAAYEMIPRTVEDISRQAKRFFEGSGPGRLSRAGGIALDPETYKAGLPFAGGAGIATERLARAGEAATEARGILAGQQKGVHEGVGKRVADWEKEMFRKGFRGVRAKPGAFVAPAESALLKGKQLIPYRTGFRRLPTFGSLAKGLKGGLWGMLGAAGLQALLGSR